MINFKNLKKNKLKPKLVKLKFKTLYTFFLIHQILNFQSNSFFK